MADITLDTADIERSLLRLIDLAETNSTNPELCAEILAMLRDVKADAARAYSAVEQTVIAAAGKKSYEVPGLGMVEIKKSTKRSAWRHDELVPVIVSHALDERQFDPDTGEALEREAETVARVLRECVSFGAGKVTGLRARGIQPDEFCVEQEDGYSVRLPPRNET